MDKQLFCRCCGKKLKGIQAIINFNLEGVVTAAWSSLFRSKNQDVIDKEGGRDVGDIKHTNMIDRGIL